MSIIEATRDNFSDVVAHGLVLVDLWGPDCTTCLALMPDVERLAGEHEGLVVAKLEAPKARRLCMQLGVMGLPAFLLYRDGEEVARLAGADVGAAQLASWLAQAIGGHDGKESSYETEEVK